MSAIGCFMVLGTWANYHGVYRHDQYQLINLGQVIYDGGQLYVDCWENKPPGVPWIIAAVLSLTGGSQTAVWLFPGLVGAVGIVTLAWAASRLYGPAECAAVTMLACVMLSARAFDTPSNHPDFYSAMFALMGTSAFLVGTRRPEAAWPCGVTAGLGWALSAGCRQTGFVGPFILVAMAVAASFQTSLLRCRRLVAVACSTWAVAVGGMIVALWWDGNVLEARDAVLTFNRDLLAAEHWERAARAAHKVIPVQGPLGLPLAFAILSVFHALRRSPRHPHRRLILGLALWFMVDNWLSLVAPSQIDRYWLATWTPLLFLTVDGFSTAVHEFRQAPARKRKYVGVAAAVVTCILTVPMVDRHIHGRYNDGLQCAVTHYLSQTRLLGERGTLRAIGERIQAMVPRSEKIYVLRYDPGIYLHANRTSAVRFTYPRGASQQAEILDALGSRPPLLILVPVEADPGPEWKLPPEGAERLYRILSEYNNTGPYLGYWFLLRSSQGGVSGAEPS